MASKKKRDRQAIKEILKHLTILVDTYFIYGNPEIDKLLHWTNDCYNETNYMVRQDYFKRIRKYKHELHLYRCGKLKKKPSLDQGLSDTALTQAIKQQSIDGQNTLYNDCINIKISNGVVRNVKGNWSNYKKAKADYRKNPYKYTGCPKIPHYVPKGKCHSVELDTQTIKIKGHHLIYKALKLNVKMSPILYEAIHKDSNDPWLNKLDKLKRIRNYWLKPIVGGAKLCVSYVVSSQKLTTYKGKPVPARNPNTVVAGDPGVDNLMALVTNDWHYNPLLICGKGIKSVNHFYNKRMAELQRIATKYKQKGILIHKKDGSKQWIYHTGKAYSKLTLWRNNKILVAIHKATDRIIEYAINCGASKIIIGRNKYWKQRSKMGKQNNQNFVGIPHLQVIKILTYKANRYGIKVVTQPESYTSQTSFLDNEKPCWYYGNNGRKARGIHPFNRRKKRGYLELDNGIKINSDVNGALQIMVKNKVFCDRSNLKQIMGVVLHPLNWSPQF